MADLPTGTITLLFTDIEGSTRLLQSLGPRYAEVLAEYRRLLRVATHGQGGHEVDTQGDGCFFAFPGAKGALAAAVAAMRAIQRYPWPVGITVPVRMGLHTGEPVNADTGYVGMDVHRAARICAAGHGGQMLLSQTTRDLVADDLPHGMSIRDLGQHRLKDLGGPQFLFQVVAAELPADFPALHSLDALPNNLPIQLTSFIGREREKADVRRLLSTTRLLMLTGEGGCGKTRLALQVAADLLEQYPDGVWQVELAPLSDPTLVPRAVASVLGVSEQPSRVLTEVVVDYLRPRSLLLIFDNCEHVLPACAQLADSLLRACPSLRMLATSREALRIAGEISWRVPSMSLPDPQRLPNLHGLMAFEAVQLFLERAAAVLPVFTVTAQNAQAIARTCHQLDGIPLAIELAAARVKVLSVDQIAARLDDRFRLLTGGSRTALPRHQTLLATLDWSYSLLSDPERAVLRRLSVFAGGWTLETAEAVCAGGGVEASDILDLLMQLVDKSLVVAETRGGEARYRLLETVRQYGWDKLVESKQAADARKRHRDWYLDLAERAEPKLRGPEQVAWGERLETEHDNLRRALEWSKAEDGGAEAWLRLAGALHWFWFTRGYASEGREWLEEALSTSEKTSTPARARALCGAGILTRRQGDFSRAGILLQESLGLFRELRNTWGSAFSLHHLAHLAENQGDSGQATALFEESLALFREAGDKWGVGWSLSCLGNMALLQGDYSRATTLLEESLVLIREVGDTSTLSYTLGYLGTLAERRRDYERATALLEEGFARARQVGDKFNISILHHRLATVALCQGDNERAVTLYRESLILRRELGDKTGLVQCLEGLAGVACAQGHYEQAVRLLGAAEVLRETLGYRHWPAYRVDHDRRVASTRAAMGEKSFAAAWAKGRAMMLERAIEYALSAEETAPLEAGEAKKPKIGKRDLLTPREREVATLVARGLTNREIAERLVVTQRTAETHVQNIFNKLGVTSRAEIAAWAVECGLYAPPTH